MIESNDDELETLRTNAQTQEHINHVRRMLRVVAVELLKRGEIHDLSKFSPEEVDTFVKFTPKLRSTTYGSDEYKGFLKEMAPALKNHYDSNRHHPEHFPRGMVDMNLVDLVEMFIDWNASTLRHADGDIVKSVEIAKARFGLSDQLAEVFLNTVDMLKSNS